MKEWFLMGGYAPYVWSTYSLAVVVLVGGLFRAKRKRHLTQRLLQGWLSRKS